MDNINCYYKHPSYYLERKLLNEIKRGLEEEALETLDVINAQERAHLANTPIRSIKNSLIGSCTLFTRAAIEANINPEDAFSLSDVFILEIEKFENKTDLQKFEYHMVKEFISMVNQNRIHSYSLPITKIINHIHENITENITLTTLSELTSRSKEYLSAEFKKEVGINLVDYIQDQKIEESKNFLEFTDMNINEISILFNFCNPGYFSSVFKKHVGIKPSVYRRSKK